MSRYGFRCENLHYDPYHLNNDSDMGFLGLLLCSGLCIEYYKKSVDHEDDKMVKN